MARGEGETGAVSSHFAARVVKIPVVGVAWDYAAHTYAHIKESSRIASFTLTGAEMSVTFVAKPVVRTFGKQIEAVDNLACRGLGTLQEKVPIITKSTDELIVDTKKLYESTVTSRLENIRKYGNDAVRSAADFGLRHAQTLLGTRLARSFITTVDGALVVTEKYVDQLMPPPQDEEKPQCNGKKREEDESEEALERLTRITSTVRRRAYSTLLLKLEYAQERSLDILLTYPISLLEFTKTHADALLEFASRLWLAVRQGDGEQDTSSGETRSPVEQQLLVLARLVSRQVASAYGALGTPQTTEEGQEPVRYPNVPSVDESDLLCKRRSPVDDWDAQARSPASTRVYVWIRYMA